MKNRIVMLTACLGFVAAVAAVRVVAGQDSQSQSSKNQQVTLTGCLVQGSEPTVFLLDNAKADPRDTNEKGRSYLLITNVASISFRDHLNHEVRISGMAEDKIAPTPPMGETPKESDLPKLTATKVTQVASTCSPPIG